MKPKRNLISVALVSALVLVAVLLALPGTAKAPSDCQQGCLAAAAAAAQTCATLPPSERGACVAAVAEELSDCLAGCPSR